MKERKRIFNLLDELSSEIDVPKIRIIGCQTGLVLYEGSLFNVPFGLCSDFVLHCEEVFDTIVITSTCQRFRI